MHIQVMITMQKTLIKMVQNWRMQHQQTLKEAEDELKASGDYCEVCKTGAAIETCEYCNLRICNACKQTGDNYRRKCCGKEWIDFTDDFTDDLDDDIDNLDLEEVDTETQTEAKE